MTRIQQERTIGIPYRNKDRAQELDAIQVSVEIEMYSEMHVRARRKYIYLAQPASAKFNELVGKVTTAIDKYEQLNLICSQLVNKQVDQRRRENSLTISFRAVDRSRKGAK